MNLPFKGWLGYGSPMHPWTPRAKSALVTMPNRCGVATHEMHAAVAEAVLDRNGVLPSLLDYIRIIGMRREARP